MSSSAIRSPWESSQVPLPLSWDCMELTGPSVSSVGRGKVTHLRPSDARSHTDTGSSGGSALPRAGGRWPFAAAARHPGGEADCGYGVLTKAVLGFGCDPNQPPRMTAFLVRGPRLSFLPHLQDFLRKLNLAAGVYGWTQGGGERRSARRRPPFSMESTALCSCLWNFPYAALTFIKGQ